MLLDAVEQFGFGNWYVQSSIIKLVSTDNLLAVFKPINCFKSLPSQHYKVKSNIGNKHIFIIGSLYILVSFYFQGRCIKPCGEQKSRAS